MTSTQSQSPFVVRDPGPEMPLPDGVSMIKTETDIAISRSQMSQQAYIDEVARRRRERVARETVTRFAVPKQLGDATMFDTKEDAMSHMVSKFEAAMANHFAETGQAMEPVAVRIEPKLTASDFDFGIPEVGNAATELAKAMNIKEIDDVGDVDGAKGVKVIADLANSAMDLSGVSDAGIAQLALLAFSHDKRDASRKIAKEAARRGLSLPV